MRVDLKFMKSVFKNSLNLNSYGLSLNTKFEKVSQWDSLGYMKIVSEIESRLNLDIEIDEIVEVNTVKKLIDLVNSKLKK